MGTVPRYSPDEIARLGDEIYEGEILPRLGPSDEGMFALIDVETGDYEVGRDAASDRLIARHPEAQIWTRQVGSRYARHFRPRLAALDRIRGLLDQPSARIGDRLRGRDELHER
ncbi:MAG TPA: hypothetical protein VN493_18170 [Thermoanaerobaculia bacterium]|nr:hypothetical protein [Thermoanaerobaculia bacterium]